MKEDRMVYEGGLLVSWRRELNGLCTCQKGEAVRGIVDPRAVV